MSIPTFLAFLSWIGYGFCHVFFSPHTIDREDFLFSGLLIWWIALIEFQILAQPFIPGRNPSCFWYLILSLLPDATCYWSVSTFMKTTLSLSLLVIFNWFSYQSSIGFIKWLGKVPFTCFWEEVGVDSSESVKNSLASEFRIKFRFKLGGRAWTQVILKSLSVRARDVVQ